MKYYNLARLMLWNPFFLVKFGGPLMGLESWAVEQSLQEFLGPET